MSLGFEYFWDVACSVAVFVDVFCFCDGCVVDV